MIKTVLLIFALATGASVHGAEVLRNPKGLLGWYEKPADKEKFLRLANAKIAHLNHALIRRDFPEATKNMSDAEIDAAVLNCAGFISVPQAGSHSVNTEIPLAGGSVMAYRPLGYGRAAVFKCFDGLIDMKGAGGRTVGVQDEYKTGLFSLAKALREELMQRVAALLLEREGYAAGTVETYGQIDLGFDVITPEGNKIPAGGVLRQAHRRANPVGSSGPKGAEIEKILRKYGVTSSHTLPEKTWHLITDQNAQIDANGSLFDFETIYRYPKFLNSPVNPDPQLELPLAVWDEFQKVQPWADGLAKEIRAGTADGARVEAEMEKWLGPLRERLKSCEDSIRPGGN